MNELVALRLYFHQAEKVEHKSFWHRFTRPSLASHVIKSANSRGIEQVLVHHVHGGYLPGGKPTLRHVEYLHPHLPHCIELIDIESKLRTFLHDHAHQLKNARALFLPCEPAVDSLG